MSAEQFFNHVQGVGAAVVVFAGHGCVLLAPLCVAGPAQRLAGRHGEAGDLAMDEALFALLQQHARTAAHAYDMAKHSQHVMQTWARS